ncbi:MAG: sigma-54 interaction domain-containing protein [Thermoanaerobaculia bacterium]
MSDCPEPRDDPAFRRLEERSKGLQRKNELILDSAGEGIYGLDTDGMTTFVNPAAAEMLGCSTEELIGQPMHVLLHHTRPDGSPYPRQECPIYAAFKDGEVHSVDDEVFWRKDGSSFPVEYTSTPIREYGELVGAVVVFRNLTEIKRSEENLGRALAEVEHLKSRLEAENVYLQEEIRTEHNFEEIVGRSAAIKRVLEAVETVAGSEANVVIEGETGTGKELIARALHNLSSRKDKTLIKVNCASIPRELFESEFFGHVKGAFTGALRNRAGRFELADEGTLFLDEVGEIPLEMQSKLLRVLQEGQFERIGDERTQKVDVRVVAATNRDLKREVEKGRVRQDLYYRLNVFPIEVPPLRDRKEDIPLLASHFLAKGVRGMERTRPSLTRENVRQLQSYDWPGNVRELQNVIERAVITSRGGALRFDFSLEEAQSPTPAAALEAPVEADATRVITEAEMRRKERANLLVALEQCGWRVYGADGAAALLGVKPSTLASRIKKMGLEAPPGAGRRS